MKSIQYLALIAAALLSGAVQAQTSVKIGVLNDMSGPYANSSGLGAVAAARLAVEDFGAENKDIKVEIVSADHQNKPDVGSSIARTWLDVAKVDVIVDLPNSAVAFAAVNEIVREKNKVLLVSSGATSSSPDPSARPTPSTGPTIPGRSPTVPAR